MNIQKSASSDNSEDAHPNDKTKLYEEHDEMITTNIIEPTVPAEHHTLDILQGPPVFENHQDLYALAFPTLFPYGKAVMFDHQHKHG